MSGKTLAAAAAAAGMSERTARTWQRGALPSTAKAPRTWRTREDPFADVWQSEVVPQLVADTDGRLQVLTLFKVLCRRHPGRFQAGQLRTLQRRARVRSFVDRGRKELQKSLDGHYSVITASRMAAVSSPPNLELNTVMPTKLNPGGNSLSSLSNVPVRLVASRT